MYTVGATYTRNDIYESLNLPQEQRGGDWLNGYHRHGSDYYIFCNVGVPGRTGHDYENYWEGEKLVWHGKNHSHFDQQAIRNLVSGDFQVRVFYRESDRAPFTYAGIGSPVRHEATARPVRIDWIFGSDDAQEAPVFTDEYPPGARYKEGERTQVFVNRYERDRNARDACIQHFGARCRVCNLDFGEVYGEIGKGFIHVHHTVPVSEQGGQYNVDPIKDLVPVCPNCHAMLHRRNPPYSVAEMRQIL